MITRTNVEGLTDLARVFPFHRRCIMVMPLVLCQGFSEKKEEEAPSNRTIAFISNSWLEVCTTWCVAKRVIVNIAKLSQVDASTN